MEQLPKLEYISVMATGYNMVDTQAAKARGIVVSNAAGYSTQSVVQHTFALMLELFSKVGLHNFSVKEEKIWENQQDFSYTIGSISEIYGKTLGLVGFGEIGKNVAKVAQAFGLKVLANRKNQDTIAPEGIAFVSLDELVAQSDIISLHCPLTADNAQMVNADFLQKIKKTAFLINTARCGLIDENALAFALINGEIAGAGLDVLSTEPPNKNNPLLSAKNCFITPHIAWASFQARQRLMDILVNNTRAFLSGTPENLVNP